METYIGTKVIKAKPMTVGEWHDYRCQVAHQPAEDVPTNMPGYMVEHFDGSKPNDSRHEGCISWSPKYVLENNYHPFSSLTFGEAIEMLKMGHKVARKGWGEKGDYLKLPSAAAFMVEKRMGPQLKEWATGGVKEAEARHAIKLFSAGGDLSEDWRCCQADMLAEDWQIVE